MENISVTQLREMLDDPATAQQVVLVDARLAEEQAVSMLPGAITASQFERRKAELPVSAAPGHLPLLGPALQLGGCTWSRVGLGGREGGWPSMRWW